MKFLDVLIRILLGNLDSSVAQRLNDESVSTRITLYSPLVESTPDQDKSDRYMKPSHEEISMNYDINKF